MADPRYDNVQLNTQIVNETCNTADRELNNVEQTGNETRPTLCSINMNLPIQAYYFVHNQLINLCYKASLISRHSYCLIFPGTIDIGPK